MPPLQQPTQDDMEKQWGGELRKRVRFRTDCAKCTLARTDCHVRLNYTTASGSGKKRNPANNPACVEYRHVISTTRRRVLCAAPIAACVGVRANSPVDNRS